LRSLKIFCHYQNFAKIAGKMISAILANLRLVGEVFGSKALRITGWLEVPASTGKKHSPC